MVALYHDRRGDRPRRTSASAGARPSDFALTENPLADPMEGRTIKPRPVVRRKSKAEAAPTPRFPGFDGEDSLFAADGGALFEPDAGAER